MFVPRSVGTPDGGFHLSFGFFLAIFRTASLSFGQAPSAGELGAPTPM